MSKFLQRACKQAGSVAVLTMMSAVAIPAYAQVIEISDDGEMRTFSKPTRFVEGEVSAQPETVVTTRPPAGDRFEQAARTEGVDVKLLQAVAWAESRGRMDAVSPKGALGIMQLMPGTAAELGVNPRDPDDNVRGGARYLARQLSRFQSVPLALAAYNAGPGAVLRWGGIPPYAETRAYVASIVARMGKPLLLPLAPAAPRQILAKASPRPVDLMLIEVP